MRPPWFKVRPWFVVGALGGVAALLMAIRTIAPYLAFRDPGWKTVVINQVASPDGAYIAAVMDDLGPAYVADHSSVSLRLSSEKFNPEHAPVVLFLEDRHRVTVTWTTPKNLTITFSCSDEDVLAKDERWKDVIIRLNNTGATSRSEQPPAGKGS
jgi:hypothetical protein